MRLPRPYYFVHGAALRSVSPALWRRTEEELLLRCARKERWLTETLEAASTRQHLVAAAVHPWQYYDHLSQLQRHRARAGELIDEIVAITAAMNRRSLMHAVSQVFPDVQIPVAGNLIHPAHGQKRRRDGGVEERRSA